MHVYDAADLYEKYMNPKWGDRIPRGRRNGKHGRVEFQLGGGTKLRAISEVIDHGQKQVADRYGFAVERDYDAVSQVQAMDMEGLDVAVLFRTSPLHCDDSFEAGICQRSLPGVEQLDRRFLQRESKPAKGFSVDHFARRGLLQSKKCDGL